MQKFKPVFWLSPDLMNNCQILELSHVDYKIELVKNAQNYMLTSASSGKISNQTVNLPDVLDPLNNFAEDCFFVNHNDLGI